MTHHSTATLTVKPSQNLILGDGFGTTGVTVVVVSATAAAFAGQIPIDGTIAITNFSFTEPGTYTVTAYENGKRVAETSVEVAS